MGRFIGRLGVVSLPAVEVGLDLAERVVRRHVAKLEAAGLLGRAPWIWGEGSVLWLTAAGLELTGLGGLRPINAPPSATMVSHGLLVGWSAARAERQARRWQSARELALDFERWAVRVRDERGSRYRLPDLAVWRRGAELPVAVIAESGLRRAERQRRILEAWRDAIWTERYAAVRYDCASESVAARITHLATKVQLTAPRLVAVAHSTPNEIRAVVPDADDAEARPAQAPRTALPDITTVPDTNASAPAPLATSPEAITLPTPERRPAPRPETAEEFTERQRLLRELFLIPEPKPRRGWRG